MGDRANIVLKQNPGGLKEGEPNPRIYLYTHNDGFELPRVLQRALVTAKGHPSGYPSSRWDDESYLGRIIFSELTKNAYDETTGYGISTYQTDGGYALLVVDAETQTVSVEGDERYGGGLTISFEDYCSIDFGDEDEDSAWDILAKRAAGV